MSAWVKTRESILYSSVIICSNLSLMEFSKGYDLGCRIENLLDNFFINFKSDFNSSSQSVHIVQANNSLTLLEI